MVTEDYVSFETAKLLKEKGFDWEVHRSYLINDNVFIPGDINDVPLRKDAIRIPTIQMAMKWLREVHHLFIGCEPRLSFTDFYWITANIYRVRKKSSLYHTEDVDDYHCVASCDSHSYEEACEAAIKYCLENLI